MFFSTRFLSVLFWLLLNSVEVFFIVYHLDTWYHQQFSVFTQQFQCINYSFFSFYRVLISQQKIYILDLLCCRSFKRKNLENIIRLTWNWCFSWKIFGKQLFNENERTIQQNGKIPTKIIIIVSQYTEWLLFRINVRKSATSFWQCETTVKSLFLLFQSLEVQHIFTLPFERTKRKFLFHIFWDKIRYKLFNL